MKGVGFMYLDIPEIMTFKECKDISDSHHNGNQVEETVFLKYSGKDHHDQAACKKHQGDYAHPVGKQGIGGALYILRAEIYGALVGKAGL